MKHRTLRCAAETLVLLLIAAMAVFLAAGLHQRAPDGALSTLSTGWYQLTDGVRREVTLPAARPPSRPKARSRRRFRPRCRRRGLRR